MFKLITISVPDIDVCQGHNITVKCPEGTNIKMDPTQMSFGVSDIDRCAEELPTDFTSPLTYASTFGNGSVPCERTEFCYSVRRHNYYVFAKLQSLKVYLKMF